MISDENKEIAIGNINKVSEEQKWLTTPEKATIEHQLFCTRCHVLGHNIFNCPKKPDYPPCRNCGRTNHKEENCFLRSKQNGSVQNGIYRRNFTPRNINIITCYGCGEKGHYKRQCQQRGRSRSRENLSRRNEHTTYQGN